MTDRDRALASAKDKTPVRMPGIAMRLDRPAHAVVADAPRTVRFLWFPMGMAQMDEMDWRQFEITPENAQQMVAKGNAAIASGEEITVNYGHDEEGPRAGLATAFDLTQEGVFGTVKWNDTARAAIQEDPPQWDGFSPEFWATFPTDEEGHLVVINGRVLMRPYELTGGALTNCGAMPTLAVAANRATFVTADQCPRCGGKMSCANCQPKEAARASGHNPNPSPSPASNAKELEMKVSPENQKLLGIADGATEDEFNKALAAKLATAPEPKRAAVAAAPGFVTAEQFAELSSKMEARAADFDKMLQTELAKRAETAERDRKVETLVLAGVTSGKVTSKQRDAAKELAASNPAAFEKFLADAPGKAPVGAIFNAGKDKSANDESERELKAGAFADLDPRNPEHSKTIAAAAKRYIAANPDRKLTVLAAASELTRAQAQA